jgi:N-acetylglucosaminyl-diphospho-decaprenol L-rhamnosyltransferase
VSEAVRIVVVSWNTRELLARCLDSLVAEVEAGRCEVVVVDNGSDDGSAAMVAERFSDTVTLVEPGANLGFGTAVNLGARTGEEPEPPFVAAANADIELEPGALEALLDRISRDDSCGAVAPRLIASDGSTQHSVHSFPGVALALAVITGIVRLPGMGDRLLIEGRWNPDRPRAVPWAHGAFVLFRRSAFEAVGGFDERQWMYAEDVDIAWRLREVGYSFLYEPAARVRHAGSAAAIKAFGDERSARHIRAVYSWMARRRGPGYARLFAGVNVAGSALRWLLCQPGRLLGFSGSAARSAMFGSYVKLHAQGFAPRRRLLAGDGGRQGPGAETKRETDTQ